MRVFCRPQFFRRKWITSIGADFVIQNYSSLSLSPLFSAARAAGTGTLALWICSSEDSCFALRQGCSAVLHTCRIAHSATTSLLDIAGSQALSVVLPGIGIFSPKRSAARGVRRLMHALRSNGGVYDDLGSIVHTIVNGLRAVIPPDVVRAVNAFAPLGPTRVFDTFRTVVDLLRPFPTPVHRLSYSGIRHGPFLTHDGKLADGRSVQITVIEPRVARMRSFDLLPFRALAKLLELLPGLSETADLAHALVDRLDVTIPREIAARYRILTAIGVGSAVRKFPLAVPRPIEPLCSDCVLVTEGVGEVCHELYPDVVRKVIQGSVQLMFAHSLIVPDISKGNICWYEGRPSLLHFGPIAKIDAEALHRGLRFATSAATAGRIDGQKVLKTIGENATFLINATEAIAGANVLREAAELGVFSLEPYAGGLLGKAWSSKGNQNTFPACLLGWTRWLPF